MRICLFCLMNVNGGIEESLGYNVDLSPGAGGEAEGGTF